MFSYCSFAPYISGYINLTFEVAYAYEQNLDSPYEGINIALVLQLDAGQQVWVSPNQINEMYGVSAGDGLLSWFSGHLLYAD